MLRVELLAGLVVALAVALGDLVAMIPMGALVAVSAKSTDCCSSSR